MHVREPRTGAGLFAAGERSGPGAIEDHRARLRPGLVLTTQAHLDEAGGLLAELVGGIPAIATDAIPDDAAHEWRPLRIGASDTALLQYSSGSTSSPKGIIVTHANVLANQAMVKQSFRHSRATTFAGWLPFFHDMGLFGGIVQPMFVGAPAC